MEMLSIDRAAIAHRLALDNPWWEDALGRPDRGVASTSVLRTVGRACAPAGSAGNRAAWGAPRRQDDPRSDPNRRPRACPLRVGGRPDLFRSRARRSAPAVRRGASSRNAQSTPRRVRRDPIPAGLGASPQRPRRYAPADALHRERVGRCRAQTQEQRVGRRSLYRLRTAPAHVRRVSRLHRRHGRRDRSLCCPRSSTGYLQAQRTLRRLRQLRRLSRSRSQRGGPLRHGAFRSQTTSSRRCCSRICPRSTASRTFPS
jgi:hypothetical protein